MTSVELLIGLISPVMLGALYLGPWQWGWADHARQSVFEERDAIFDMATAGELEFGSDVYETVRAGLNCLIRFAHRATVLRLLFHFAFRRPSDREVARIHTAIVQIADEEIRERVSSHVHRAEMAVVASVVARSLVTFSLLLVFFAIQAACRRVTGGGHAWSFSETLEKAGSVVQAEATVICA